jgi:hypothetical protein
LKANPSLAVKAEIAHASSLAPSALAGKATSINDFCNHFGLSKAAKETIVAQLSKTSLAVKSFQFDQMSLKL